MDTLQQAKRIAALTASVRFAAETGRANCSASKSRRWRLAARYCKCDQPSNGSAIAGVTAEATWSQHPVQTAYSLRTVPSRSLVQYPIANRTSSDRPSAACADQHFAVVSCCLHGSDYHAKQHIWGVTGYSNVDYGELSGLLQPDGSAEKPLAATT